MKYVYAVATSDEQVHVGETRNLSATISRIAIEVEAGGKDCLWCMVSPTVAGIYIETNRLRGGYDEAVTFMSSRQLPYIELTPAKYNGNFHFVASMHRRSSVRLSDQDDVDASVIRVVGGKTLTSGVIINRCRKYSRDDVTASIRRLTERGALREEVTTHERNLTQVYSYTLDPSYSS